jgi:hypothetical protein
MKVEWKILEVIKIIENSSSLFNLLHAFKFYIFIPKSNYLKGSFELLCLVIHNDKLVVQSKSLEICSNFSKYLHHGY